MSLRVKNISKLQENTTFNYNLFFEMILLLNLLTNSQHFSHNDWAIEFEKKLPKESLDTIAFWGSFNDWGFLLNIITKKDLLHLNSTAIFLNFFQGLSHNTVLDSLWGKPGIWQKANEKEYRFSETKNYDILLKSPQESVEHLKSFLLIFYQDYFKPCSQTIELSLIQDINIKYKHLAKHGLASLLPQLSKKLYIEKDTLIIEGWPEKNFEAGRNLDNIILIPQIFYAPHLLINYKTIQNRLYIGYPLQHSPFIGKSDITKDEIEYMAGVFHVLSEPTRLKILLSLHGEPASNQELAKKLNLSKPTISRHISRLRRYNFISGKEIENNRILYSISENRTMDLLKNFGFFPD